MPRPRKQAQDPELQDLNVEEKSPEVQETPRESKPMMSESDIDRTSSDTGDELRDGPKTKVRLHQTSAASTDQRLPDETVTINGYTWQIQRGQDVEVPEQVAQVLRDAERY